MTQCGLALPIMIRDSFFYKQMMAFLWSPFWRNSQKRGRRSCKGEITTSCSLLCYDLPSALKFLASGQGTKNTIKIRLREDVEEDYVTRNAQYHRIHATLGGEDWEKRVAISSGGLPEAWMALTSQGWCLTGFTAAYPSRHCPVACTLEIRRCALCGVCLGLLIIV